MIDTTETNIAEMAKTRNKKEKIPRKGTIRDPLFHTLRKHKTLNWKP